MTEFPDIRWRTRSAMPILLAGVLAACHVADPTPTFLPPPYRTAADTFSTATAEAESMYGEVLRFYRPSGDRVRWINRELLPIAPADSGIAMLDSSVAAHLLAQLGPAFCLLEKRDTCRGDSGGELRVSPIYRGSPTSARVAVRFKGVEPHAPTIESSQVFSLEAVGGRWTIRGRHASQ